mgnify:CR=1 FL=1
MNKAWETSFKGNDLLILLSLADNASDEGYCFPSWNTIRNKTKVSKGTLSYTLKAFEHFGLIERNHRNRENGSNKSNEYLVKVFDIDIEEFKKYKQKISSKKDQSSETELCHSSENELPPRVQKMNYPSSETEPAPSSENEPTIEPSQYEPSKEPSVKKEKKKKDEIILPENLNIQAFEMWCEYKGSSYSKQGKILSINKLVQYPHHIQLQMVENSIMNNYKGLFEIKPTATAPQQQQQNKSVEQVLTEYIADRKAGASRDIATLQAKQKLNWGLHKELQRVIADFEYQLHKRTAPAENKEAYNKFIAENSPI